VRLGSGPRLGAVRALGIPWHVHLWIGGLSISDDVLVGRERYRTRSWLVTAAGPAANLLLAGSGAWLGGFAGVADLLPREGYGVLPTFVVANLAGAAIALWPWTMIEGDEEFPTDGLQLLRIPRMTDEEAEEELIAAGDDFLPRTAR
jgi:hypothetical protein